MLIINKYIYHCITIGNTEAGLGDLKRIKIPTKRNAEILKFFRFVNQFFLNFVDLQE